MSPYRTFIASLLSLFALAVSAATLPAADVDKYLPADTEMVLTINIRQILDSALVKKEALGMLTDLIQGSEEAKTTLTKLGLDPLKDIDRLTVAGPGGT